MSTGTKKQSMRNALSIIILILLLSSCSKEHQLDDFKDQVAGKWEKAEFICGECPNPRTIYPQGNGSIMVLFKDGVFERRLHDSVTFKGKFFLTRSDECGSRSDIALSTNEYSNSIPGFVEIASGRLRISTPSCYADGASTYYRRVE